MQTLIIHWRIKRDSKHPYTWSDRFGTKSDASLSPLSLLYRCYSSTIAVQHMHHHCCTTTYLRFWLTLCTTYVLSAIFFNLEQKLFGKKIVLSSAQTLRYAFVDRRFYYSMDKIHRPIK